MVTHTIKCPKNADSKLTHINNHRVVADEDKRSAINLTQNEESVLTDSPFRS